MKQGSFTPAAGARKLRHRTIAVAAAAAAALVGAPVTYALIAGNNDAMPFTEAARSFVNELLNRSPGARTDANLIKTKKKPSSQMLSAAVMPKDNAISSTVPASLVDLLSPKMPIAEFILPPDAPPMPFAQLVPADEASLPIGPGGGGGVGVVPSGGGGGVVSPPGETTPNPPVISAVPEPSTWATMLLGFALTGGALRHRRAFKRSPVSRSEA